MIVVVHGGFWRSAYGLEHMEPLASALTDEGFATWSIEYRRVGEDGGGWPATLEDVASAVDALREVADEHGLDLGRAISTGFSAGGHLALWAAARHRIAQGPLARADPLHLSGAVPLAGVCDLALASATGVGAGAADALMGGPPARFPDRYAAADPAALVPVGIRVVLVHGTADENVPFEQSASYHAKASAAGDDVRLVTLPGARHFDLIDVRGTAYAAVLEAVRSITMPPSSARRGDT